MALVICPECGKEVSSWAESCVNCGCPIKTNVSTVEKPKKIKTNTLAVVGCIASIVSLFINLWGIIGIVGIILSGAGILQAGTNGESGRGTGVFGVIIGIASTIYYYVQIQNLINAFSRFTF